ncbi:hypothetical protein PoB_004478800 [Plakobranchus ocellatus]|uniref:Uncharacterized protein n=1 Tax=Plakobranchus ocellatus TaxID=259542 RepID=A0AAV4BHH9_9GAST|nr:hypothetical protein PoB_004478800 [Plakobranchus ocellatus]
MAAVHTVVKRISGHRRGQYSSGHQEADQGDKQTRHHVHCGTGCGSSPQQGDLRLSGPPSGQGGGGGARTRYRKVLADLRAGSLATVSPTRPGGFMK